MVWKLVFAIYWIFELVKGLHGDESLSFSLPNNRLISTTSFWHNTLPSRLLEKDIQFNLYLNKPQGLIFYAIDDSYQSLWLEFDQSQLTISYYNFKTDMIDQYKQDTNKWCVLEQTEDSILNLKFSLSINELIIVCNRNEQKIFYSPNVELAINGKMTIFLEEMKYPVPHFNTSYSKKEGITYLWIGNTPDTNTDSYRNKRLANNPNNFLGCIQSLKIGLSLFNVTSTGIRHGNMIESSCKPVCGTNPCYNRVRCVERWRQRFSCQCGYSEFIGKRCNENYGVEFNGDSSVDFAVEYKLQSFQIAFKQLKLNNDPEAMKVFSIQFIFNQSLHVYIDARGFLQIMFTTENAYNIEKRFKSQLENNKTYILFVGADINAMNFKLADSQYRYIIDEKTISRSLPNLISMKVLVGDSHSVNMKWMKRFHGCISNLVLTATKREFLWNQIPNFDKLPKCDKKMAPKNLSIKKNSSSDSRTIMEDFTPSSVNSNKGINNSNMTYIIVGITFILIGVIVSIVIYTCLKRTNGASADTKQSNQNEKGLSFESVTYQPYSAPNSPPIPYKPPYKARSMSHSSNIGKSVTSLPPSITPTLVTPEDGNC